MSHEMVLEVVSLIRCTFCRSLCHWLEQGSIKNIYTSRVFFLKWVEYYFVKLKLCAEGNKMIHLIILN